MKLDAQALCTPVCFSCGCIARYPPAVPSSRLVRLGRGCGCSTGAAVKRVGDEGRGGRKSEPGGGGYGERLLRVLRMQMVLGNVVVSCGSVKPRRDAAVEGGEMALCTWCVARQVVERRRQGDDKESRSARGSDEAAGPYWGCATARAWRIEADMPQLMVVVHVWAKNAAGDAGRSVKCRDSQCTAGVGGNRRGRVGESESGCMGPNGGGVYGHERQHAARAASGAGWVKVACGCGTAS
ncbi:hypothetical protein K438DRAFT_1755098 [Mycena galopus ATCC 62051]|nr:hypothetical protein K438DRAFT_1755098 [Mycena galopus ATCC 62051]